MASLDSTHPIAARMSGAAAAQASRRRELVELFVGYGLILVVVWTPRPAQNVLYWITVAWIVVTGILARDRSRPIGLGLTGLRESLWIVPGGVALFFIGMWIAAWAHTLHRLYGPLPLAMHVLTYGIWALIQQFILQVYVLLRLLRLGLSRPRAIGVAALMFAVAHIPNPVLTPAVIVWGTVSCLLYLRYRNLYAIALAHGMLGMCLAITVPNGINHHMRVGLGYLMYPTHRAGLELTSR
ncbi:MAG TPA: CPBP family glutamic-type intramembrane protease [Acidobacteriaceae bacterium]|nr:CPBP family glutamic-type intramembrane protease [Acidobacteriaceae bacterium]